MSDMLPRKREVTITVWMDPTLEAEREALEDMARLTSVFANSEFSVREEKTEEEKKREAQIEIRKLGL